MAPWPHGPWPMAHGPMAHGPWAMGPGIASAPRLVFFLCAKTPGRLLVRCGAMGHGAVGHGPWAMGHGAHLPIGKLRVAPGPWPMGPWAGGPWAMGSLPGNQWANGSMGPHCTLHIVAPWAMGPWVHGPWAHGPMGHGPWGLCMLWGQAYDEYPGMTPETARPAGLFCYERN